MRCSTLFAASAAILAYTVAADEYSGDGNVDMTIGSDGPVFFGDQTPWSVLDTLNQHCSGGTCNGVTWDIPTTLTNSAAGTNTPTNLNNGKITVNVLDATYIDGDLPAMVEALKNLASQPQIHAVKTEHYCDSDNGTGSPVGPGRLARFRRDVTCNRDENPAIDQYSTAATFYIRVNQDDGSLRSEIRVTIQAGVVDDDLSQTICNDLATAGSAIAGAFTGGAAAAAGFALGGLACGAI